MISIRSARLCSAERCLATVSPDQRWCRGHRPCRESAPRNAVHRIARLILRDPDLRNEQIEERLGVFSQQIVEARKLIGIPDPGHQDDLLPWLERALPLAEARAAATCRVYQETQA